MLVASTGVIGQPLPIERIVQATPRLVPRARADGLDDFARAIMTTDRFEKRALQLVPLGPKTRARIVGVAKGAGHDRAQHGHHARLLRAPTRR